MIFEGNFFKGIQRIFLARTFKSRNRYFENILIWICWFLRCIFKDFQIYKNSFFKDIFSVTRKGYFPKIFFPRTFKYSGFYEGYFFRDIKVDFQWLFFSRTFKFWNRHFRIIFPQRCWHPECYIFEGYILRTLNSKNIDILRIFFQVLSMIR